MQYIFALMYRSGHAEAQIIDPVSKRTRLGIDFHGAAPKTPESFEGRGALLIPISEESVKALEAKMNALKRCYGDGTTPQQALDRLIVQLDRLKKDCPACSDSVQAAVSQLNGITKQAEANHASLVDCLQPVRDILKALAETLHPSLPEAAERVAGPSNTDSLLHQFRYANTGYYCSNELSDIYKYERKNQFPVDFVGDEVEAITSISRHKRPTDAPPLVGTNCLHFPLQAAHHIGGIPLSSIDYKLYDSTKADDLESVILEHVVSAPQKGEGPNGMQTGLFTLSSGTPIGVVYSEAQDITFPTDIKDLQIQGKNIIDTLASARQPLLNPSLLKRGASLG